MTNKKYQVISLHFTTDCNLRCPMCYRPKDTKPKKDFLFFLQMIPHLAELTHQVALGGGEPFMHPLFIQEFAATAKEHGLITNVTTNGTLPIKPYIKDVEMVSISFDRYKVRNNLEASLYLNLTRDLKDKVRVGTNLLIDSYLVEHPDAFATFVNMLFKIGFVERVFALYPKNWDFLNILKIKKYYFAFSKAYEHFYVDDLTSKILTENKYYDWETPCHYGSGLVSINENGIVTGCSFDSEDNALLKLEKPEDILRIEDVEAKKRYYCPHLGCKGECMACLQNMKEN